MFERHSRITGSFWLTSLSPRNYRAGNGWNLLCLYLYLWALSDVALRCLLADHCRFFAAIHRSRFFKAAGARSWDFLNLALCEGIDARAPATLAREMFQDRPVPIALRAPATQGKEWKRCSAIMKR